MIIQKEKDSLLSKVLFLSLHNLVVFFSSVIVLWKFRFKTIEDIIADEENKKEVLQEQFL